MFSSAVWSGTLNLCFSSLLALFLIKAWANKKNLGYGSDGTVWQPTHFSSSYFSSSVSRNLHFGGTIGFWMLELRRQLFSVLGKNSMTKSNCRKDNFIFKSSSFAVGWVFAQPCGVRGDSTGKWEVCFKGWAFEPFENLAPGGFH